MSQTLQGSGPMAVARPICTPRTAASLMVLYLLVVGFIVFWPSADIASGSVNGIWAVLDHMGLGWVSPSAVEFTTNVLLFVPLSFLGSTLWPRWRWKNWLLVGFLGTLTVELSQLLFLSGRSAQLPDVVANTLGALLGYRLVTWVRRH